MSSQESKPSSDSSISPDFSEIVGLYSNNKLCEVIVSFRYLGIMKGEAINAMEELAKRRQEGSLFNFEKEIESMINDLPKIDISLSEIFNQFKIPKL